MVVQQQIDSEVAGVGFSLNPLTRYLPLAAEMVTRPGERRRLYADAALSKGMTLNAPISPMGLSWMEDFMIPFLEKIQLNAGPMKGLLFTAGGRMYMNLSNVMWLVNSKALSKSSTANDAAVLLEIGGVLQHGAVIAREYGKPCVAGIDGLMTKLKDGQKVEVDGPAGVVRLLS